MAVSHKDWELPNSRIWLAEIDIDRGLDFPISTDYILPWKRCKLNTKILTIFFQDVSSRKYTYAYYGSAKPDEEKNKNVKRTSLAE